MPARSVWRHSASVMPAKASPISFGQKTRRAAGNLNAWCRRSPPPGGVRRHLSERRHRRRTATSIGPCRFLSSHGAVPFGLVAARCLLGPALRFRLLLVPVLTGFLMATLLLVALLLVLFIHWTFSSLGKLHRKDRVTTTNGTPDWFPASSHPVAGRRSGQARHEVRNQRSYGQRSFCRSASAITLLVRYCARDPGQKWTSAGRAACA